MTNHTPRPWCVEALKRTRGWIIRGPQGEAITDGPIWAEHHADESIANALLIANAPEMLSALYFVRDHLTMLTADHKLGKDKWMIAAQERTRAAIAKARE